MTNFVDSEDNKKGLSKLSGRGVFAFCWTVEHLVKASYNYPDR